ncbi:hypothetical protein [Pseudoflavonifractor phocaeensis]|uniref:hypothetical protein n=1 Tax=Pseudoflavonifractor phocaeensis TaxID=1870988 RepID=UPI001F3125B1|nr:hypothetical protein [Pseudoflavonifractor phocaeensis]MCF2661195.1 hypothetical protein [Pseudoflavonifractor phocaeensis]
MDTRNIIEGIKARIFDPSYASALKTAYDDQVKAGYFETEEKEYALGAEFLSQKLSEEQKAILASMEANYAEKYSYASTYPFYCGLLCAFEQFFLPSQKQIFDFSTSINEDLNTLPRMKRHIRYHELNTQILDETNHLLQGADEETTEHITSISCGWDQRAHSASVYAFYIGYRFGLDTIDAVVPMGSMDLMPKTLYLEYELGFTTPYKSREREKERTANE